MGCAQSGGGSKQDNERSKAINKQLQKEKKKIETEIKLLLLGAGESGKSTIAKQMKIIHLSGFSADERKSYKSIINNNIITSMRSLCQATVDLDLDINEASEKARDKFLDNEEYVNGGVVTPQLAAEIKLLWQDQGIKEAFRRNAEFQLNDSAAYYFDKIDTIVASNYIPDEQDILRSRAKTTGIIETLFSCDRTNFRMVDVGGQRSERKKWMHCFNDVTAVIFCVAMSEYNLKLYEDDTTNRMHESLKLFHEICNNKWFINTAMILFLNKRDLFEEKIKKFDLNMCFPEYKGGKNYDNASAYVRDKFLAENEQKKKQIYPQITCATDTRNVEHVFNAAKYINY